jgi:excisionase family DNA binding protein
VQSTCPATHLLNNLAQCDHALNCREVAALLQLHPLTVYRYARQGRLPAFRVGSAVRFNPQVLAQFLAGGQ